MPLHVELVSPERVLFEGDADMLVARTVGGGDIAFLPGHTKFLGALETWTVDMKLSDGSRELAAVHGGFVSVSDDKVTILSDVAEMAYHIDEERARLARERAQEALARSDDLEAEASLRRAHARMRASGHDIG
jgi:F-type H+-transporting ATPase subunit epsilon